MYVGDNKVKYELTKSLVNNDWEIEDHLVEEYYSFKKLDKPFFFYILFIISKMYSTIITILKC